LFLKDRSIFSLWQLVFCLFGDFIDLVVQLREAYALPTVMSDNPHKNN